MSTENPARLTPQREAEIAARADAAVRRSVDSHFPTIARFLREDDPAEAEQSPAAERRAACPCGQDGCEFCDTAEAGDGS